MARALASEAPRKRLVTPGTGGKFAPKLFIIDHACLQVPVLVWKLSWKLSQLTPAKEHNPEVGGRHTAAAP